ncbi:MAG: Veg family protein [Prevotella sp.]|nr:Veg family protein [Prevotella sp.]
MRKKSQSIEAIKAKIQAMLGKDINMSVCRGRKRVSKYAGTIENTFPSVFIVRLKNNEKNTERIPCLSYSYNDVLCGEVRIDEVS